MSLKLVLLNISILLLEVWWLLGFKFNEIQFGYTR